MWRICSQQRIWSAFAKKRGLTRKAGPQVHDDLVKRELTAERLDQLWLTDITEHPTSEGKLYLCTIKDVHSNRIEGYSIDAHMKASLAVTAVNNAMLRRDGVGTIVHSDRGSQFRSNTFVLRAPAGPDDSDPRRRAAVARHLLLALHVISAPEQRIVSLRGRLGTRVNACDHRYPNQHSGDRRT